MKITILGTAAIGYPLTFCNCENCTQARIHKGKSIRKRASILINDDMLVDLGPDTQTAFTMYDKNMGNIKYLLQTHIHADHYDAGLLTTRIPYMEMKNHNKLEIYAHPECLNIMSARVSQYEKADLISEEGSIKLNIHSNIVNCGDKINIGKYIVKAIESTHDTKHGSLLYVISENNKNLFYATDTPALTDTAFEQLKEYRLDAIIMDHTFGDVNYSFSHLNEKLFIEQIDKMRKLGIIDNNTKIYGTHISHDGLSYHEAIEEKAISNGYHIAYDGLEIIL
ncbi:MAG: hypothetical protein J6D28_00130 [Bacilli bacterium]|nr:hypothetical protein [Bacilli bacterium]